MLRNLEYVACYYITGSYKNQDYGLCMRNKNYKDLAYAVSFLPYYWRAMQVLSKQTPEWIFLLFFVIFPWNLVLYSVLEDGSTKDTKAT